MRGGGEEEREEQLDGLFVVGETLYRASVCMEEG